MNSRGTRPTVVLILHIYHFPFFNVRTFNVRTKHFTAYTNQAVHELLFNLGNQDDNNLILGTQRFGIRFVCRDWTAVALGTN